MTSKTKIQEYYCNKVVLITGGMGFTGKLILEKLLRTCPDVQKVYLLARGKNGCNAQDRVETMLQDQMFESMIRKCQKFRNIIKPINGDVSEFCLGLNPIDKADILNQVNVIFHCAASVKLDEELKRSVAVNMVGTKSICELALDMRKLESMVHVSTAYAHCQHSHIEEKVYFYDMSPDDFISLVNESDSNVVNSITAQLLDRHPNTYLYTKSMSEGIVNTFADRLPIVIFRPAIMTATYAEPEPGWVDQMGGATTVIAATYPGLMKTMMCNHEATANVVPADMTVNAIIALGYCVGSGQHNSTLLSCSISSSNTVPVVNYVMPECNRITWYEFRIYLLLFIRMFPSNTLYWYPFLCMPTNAVTAGLQWFFLHYLPVLTFCTIFPKKREKISKLYKNIRKINRLCHFTSLIWSYEKQNMRRLWDILEDEDQKLFPFILDNINWSYYMSNYVQGVRKYMLKDDPKTLPMARERLKRWYFIHQITIASLITVAIGACLFITIIIF